MTEYVKSTNFASKDSLASGNPLKIVKGTEIDTEFNNIATAVATKADLSTVNSELALKAPLFSPALTGTPTAPTASANTNTTQVATTAFVQGEKVSPSFTGTPTVPTAAVNTNTTQAASTAFVVAQIADDAPTKTGTGASGTWGINISGNAATVSNGVYNNGSTYGINISGNAATASYATSAGSAPVTTALVLSATAAASAGAVGTYALLTNFSSGVEMLPGTTVSGSSTFYSNAYGENFNTWTVPAGTWRCMGYARTYGNPDRVTLFLRIS